MDKFKLKKPNELLIYEKLSGRMSFTQEEKRHMFRLKSGYEGELAFSELLPKALISKCLILYDIPMSFDGKSVQYDVIIFSDQIIYHFDIKNYSGDYEDDESRWRKIGFGEVENPLYQLERADMLLKRIVKKCGLQTKVESFLVFINPEFYLYQAKPEKRYIFRSQLNQYFKKISQSSYGVSQYKTCFLKQLSSYYIEKSPYANKVEYMLENLEPGLRCHLCRETLIFLSRRKLFCKNCHKQLNSHEVIRQHIEEYRLLFPHEKITGPKIKKWCGNRFTESAIYRVLNSKSYKEQQ